MISRRAVLGTALGVGAVGAAGAAAQLAGVLDDGLRSVGIRPHSEPDPRDVQLLSDAARDQRVLVAQFDALTDRYDIESIGPLRTVLAEQLAAVSDGTGTPARPPSVANEQDDALASFLDQVKTAAQSRYDGALESGSLAVAQVLASMSAGLSQVALAVRDAT